MIDNVDQFPLSRYVVVIECEEGLATKKFEAPTSNLVEDNGENFG